MNHAKLIGIGLAVAVMTLPAHAQPIVDMIWDETPSLRIVSPAQGETVTGPVTIIIETRGYDFDFSMASPLPVGYADGNVVPGQGHAHGYLTRIETVEWNATDAFAVSLDGRTIDFGPVEPGRYMLVVEATNNNHTSVVKNQPRDFPPVAVIWFTVE